MIQFNPPGQTPLGQESELRDDELVQLYERTASQRGEGIGSQLATHLSGD